MKREQERAWEPLLEAGSEPQVEPQLFSRWAAVVRAVLAVRARLEPVGPVRW